MLDPLERASEVLFGVIMVLTFTGSISVAEGGAVDTRTALGAALACNFAWGLVDAAMYLVGNFAERARGLSMLRAIRQAPQRGTANQIVLDMLPPIFSRVLTPIEVDSVRERLNQVQDAPALVPLNRADFAGAAGVFLLVFLSTLPIALPFVMLSNPAAALRISNAIAILMLFAIGWSLGHYTGRPGVRSGLGMVAVGAVLVGITVALGG